MLETIRTIPSDPSAPQEAVEPHWWSAPLKSISTAPHQPVHNKQKQLPSTTTALPISSPPAMMYTFPLPEPRVLFLYSSSGPSIQTLEPLASAAPLVTITYSGTLNSSFTNIPDEAEPSTDLLHRWANPPHCTPRQINTVLNSNGNRSTWLSTQLQCRLECQGNPRLPVQGNQQLHQSGNPRRILTTHLKIGVTFQILKHTNCLSHQRLLLLKKLYHCPPTLMLSFSLPSHHPKSATI